MSCLPTYRRTQTILTVFLIAMFLVGMAALTNPRGNYEWFPFYSWSMFGLVPQQETIYRLAVLDSCGHPVDFRDAAGLVNEPGSLAAYHLVQQMGLSIANQDSRQLSTLRRAFEDSYLQSGTIYQIYQTREDPLTAWRKSGMADEAEMIGTFVTGEKLP
ncbi:MAG: hypothetical protein AAF649_01410 [Verrucomicrobiota bacterium]